ncbi:hypothetical protein RQP46_004694 [Phenoliferia psychrophenolica]
MAVTKSPAFDSKTPPTPQELEAAAGLTVTNEDGQEVLLSSLYAEQKTVCIWIRHFYCGLCQDYISYLGTKITPAMLDEAGVKLIIIGCGDSAMIKPYRALLETPFPIYADMSKKTYVALGMTLRTLDQGGPGNVPEYLKRGALGNVLVSIVNAFKLGKLSSKSGDIKQLGGEFVLGPGNVCRYTHRMENTKGHAPLAELLAEVGVTVPASPITT